METNLQFSSIGDNNLLIDIRELLVGERELDIFQVKKKGWIFAKLYDCQIFDEDAFNLGVALSSLGLHKFYGAWSYNIINENDFDIYEAIPSKEGIEALQSNDYFDADNGVFFSQAPLSFFVIRPPTVGFLYIAGTKDFVLEATQTGYWEVVYDF
jgi:hypothetical protein